MNLILAMALCCVAPIQEDDAMFGTFMYRSQTQNAYSYEVNKNNYLKLDEGDRRAFYYAQQMRSSQAKPSSTPMMRIEQTAPRQANWITPSFKQYPRVFPYQYNPYNNQYNNMYHYHLSH